MDIPSSLAGIWAGGIAGRQTAWRDGAVDAGLEVLERLAIAAEMRDDVTGMHCYRVGKWAYLIARKLGVARDAALAMEVAARLHDVGKVGIPDRILQKPAALAPEEFTIVKRHTVLGARLLGNGRTPQMRLAAEVALRHHEHWDGGGYPHGLRGEACPLAARITAVADVFDALTHERPYKAAWPVAAARDELARLAGTHFDPAVVAAFDAVLVGMLREDDDIDRRIEALLYPSRLMRLRNAVLGPRGPA